LYYHGMTEVTEASRAQNFADCFRALGQLMHLLQDLSVPMHTRNDVHVYPIKEWGPKNYEYYTEKNIKNLNYTPHPPNPILLADPQPDTAYDNLVPVTGLFDRNQYNIGSDIPSDNEVIGLAEYSNANFFTQDTMWTYQHPNLNDTDYYTFRINWLNPEPVDAEDGKIDQRIYIKKTVGEKIDHFVAIDYWTFDYQGQEYNVPGAFILDKLCWKDYADKLVPRAVGYSAALLDYFFRGTIEITLPDPLAGGNSSSGIEGFDRITLFAKNTSPEGEDISGGTVQLVVKHRVAPTDEFQYIVKAIEGIHSIPRVPDESSDPIEFQFDLSDTPIPFNAKEVYSYLVYRGQLGQENDAVAVGFKDISRASLEINEPDGFIYAIIDGSVSPHEFTYVKAKLRNTTGEQLLDGTIEAVARYRKRIDYQADLSADPPLSTSREDDFSYSTSALIAMPLFESDTAQEFVFDFSADSIPVGITDLYFQVVFRGKIGVEQNDVTAVGIKDLNEPMHIGMFNSTDRFYLDGELWTAPEIRNSPDLLTRVDFNGDGQVDDKDGEPYIDPIDIDYYIAFYPTAGNTPTVVHAAYEPLPPGRHGKIIMLTGASEFNVLIEIVMITDNRYWIHKSTGWFGGVINQQQNDGIFHATIVYPYRGVIQHVQHMFTNCYPDCAGDYEAAWPELENKQPVAVPNMNP
jgi:hypothetical protein